MYGGDIYHQRHELMALFECRHPGGPYTWRLSQRERIRAPGLAGVLGFVQEDVDRTGPGSFLGRDRI